MKRTSYTATLVVSWVVVRMLLTECDRSFDLVLLSSIALLDSLKSSRVIFCTHIRSYIRSHNSAEVIPSSSSFWRGKFVFFRGHWSTITIIDDHSEFIAWIHCMWIHVMNSWHGSRASCPVGQGLTGLTLLLSWGSIKVRSSSVRRMRLGPLNSWICWILLLHSHHRSGKLVQEIQPYTKNKK